MSRRYPTADLYEERQSDFYRAPPRRSTREFAELDAELQRGQQDLGFLDDEYGRRSATAGALVVRERPPPPRSVVHEDDVVVEIDERRQRRPPRRRIEKDEVDVVLRRDEGSVRSAGSRRTAGLREPRTRNVERDEELIVDHREVRRNGRVVDHRDDIIIKSDDHGRHDRFRDDREIVLEHRSRPRPRHARPLSPPLPRARSREREEEIIIEHRRGRSRSLSLSRSPPRRRGTREAEEIDIRVTQKRESSPIRVPPEPEPLPPIVRAPIHQEIHQEVITHHRHIDHGVERAYSPEPLPRPVSPARRAEETIEVDIRRRGRGGEDEEVIVEHDHRSRRDYESALAIRHRSHSPSRWRRGYDDDVREEADYYNRKALQRGYVGEAYDGATRDWNIVDVPPGTERVRMDGAGGSSQEITWQRYNGVRRSRFHAGGREYDSGFGIGDDGERELPPVQPVASKMWTEITKDLVLRDAIDAFGYDYEETEFFFYIMDYLRYEEVLQLVEMSADMREDRRRRIREIEWEREQQLRLEHELRRRHEGERFYETEVVVDTRRRR